MEKYEINKYLEEFSDKIEGLAKALNVEKLKSEIDVLSSDCARDDFWLDAKLAQEKIATLNKLKEKYNTYQSLKSSLDSLNDLLELSDDAETLEEVSSEIIELDKNLKEFEIVILLNSKYDDYDVYLDIHPGAGGTESMDWAEMLFRMYQGYCKKHNFKMKILNLEPGEAGIKSLSVEIKGKFAYGLLQAERGVHRLVRISPFDSNARRHTSFASVYIAPIIKNDLDIQIKDEDLRVDTYLSSGHGGQGVNTTYSAVRLTYLPLNIVVTCQNERSQLKNKDEAMKVLKSKLLEIELLKAEQNLKEIKGEQLLNGFGSQIRSYVFTPYTMVKDHRTNAETSDVYGVMDGEIDLFINAYLNYKAGRNNE